MTEKLHVTIGQVKVGREGQSLHAILGSCIGVGFIFNQRRIYGLAHCLLSKSKVGSDELTGRHVDSAIASLTTMMNITPPDRRKVQVILAGGANMTMPEGTDPKRLVGSVNSSFALKAIKEAGYRLQHDDLGGMYGRQVTINCDDGTYAIAKIPRLKA
ncbi:MAG: chemotaxis protein CheD [Pseudomonadota bacterium]